MGEYVYLKTPPYPGNFQVTRAVIVFSLLLALAQVSGCNVVGRKLKSASSSTLAASVEPDVNRVPAAPISPVAYEETSAKAKTATDDEEPELLSPSRSSRKGDNNEDEEEIDDDGTTKEATIKQPSEEITLPFDGYSGMETIYEAWVIALAVDQELEATRWATSAAQRGLFAAQAERSVSGDISTLYQVSDNPIGVRIDVPTLGTIEQDVTQREGLNAVARLTKPLYTFGKITSAIDAAGANVTASQAMEVRTELDIKLDVATAYINVLRTEEQVKVAKTESESRSAHERDVKNRLDEELAVPNHYLAAQVAVADSRESLLEATNLLDISRSAYNRALGRPLDSSVNLAPLDEPIATGDLDTLTHVALGQRPEIAALNAGTRALRSQAAAVRAGKMPQIGAFGSVEFFENRFFVDESFATVGVVADWNFLDRGRIQHRATRLDQKAEELLRRRTDIESKITLQVRKSWLDLQNAREKVNVAKGALEQADENVRIVRDRYREGTGTNTEALDADTLRTKAYGNYVNSVYNVSLAQFQLRRAVGDL